MRRLVWLVVSSLAIAGAMLACGARTELGGGGEWAGDATFDHQLDHGFDHPSDGHDATPDADDASDAADVADVVIYDGPFALCGVCSADLNANETPVGPNVTQGAAWLAYELPVACDQFAAWIAIHDDTAAIRVYVDDGAGQPGAQVLPPTPTQPTGDAGWFIAPANIQLQAGRSYFVAATIAPYYDGGYTHSAWSVSGSFTRYYGSFQADGGAWQGPYHNPPMIRAGDCE